MIITRSMNIIYEEPFGGTLWLGSIYAAKDIDLLEEMGIKTVITIVKGMRILYPQSIKNIIIEAKDTKYFKLKSHFDKTIQTILEHLMKGSVLVHCNAGLSRAPTIVIAYMMKRLKWNFDRAYKYVQERRVIAPNSGFLKQLIQYSDELKESIKQISLQPQGKKIRRLTSIIFHDGSKGKSSLSLASSNQLTISTNFQSDEHINYLTDTLSFLSRKKIQTQNSKPKSQIQIKDQVCLSIHRENTFSLITEELPPQVKKMKRLSSIILHDGSKRISSPSLASSNWLTNSTNFQFDEHINHLTDTLSFLSIKKNEEQHLKHKSQIHIKEQVCQSSHASKNTFSRIKEEMTTSMSYQIDSNSINGVFSQDKM